MSDTVKVEFSDGSVWSVPVETVRQHRATVMLKYQSEESTSLHYWYVDTLELFKDSYEIKDWMWNNMNWSDVEEVTEQLSTPRPADYNKEWSNVEIFVAGD